jgi:hypothetical protein
MKTDYENELSRLNVAVSNELLPEVQEEDNGKISVRLQLTQLSPDPQNYKPYSPQFKAPEDQPLQVQVEILKKYVKETKEDGTIVLSAMGLARVAQLICTAIARIHVDE